MFRDIAFALRTVATTPERLKALFSSITTPLDIARFLTEVVPYASELLDGIRVKAESIPDPQLREEALASIDAKAFHVAGACIHATFLPPDAAQAFIEIVVPLETIYDYLDNLCDRHPIVDPHAYPVLHQAIADALDPSLRPRNYYASGPNGHDGGYLAALVEQTQRALAHAPHLDRLKPVLAEAARFYSELQSNKHLPVGEREIVCVEWYERNRQRFGELDWHEFACACGSNFHVFAPLFAAFSESPDTIEAAYDAYFPYVCALHILLDSFIDQAEDREHGDLNFAVVYGGEVSLRRRVAQMTAEARSRLAALPNPRAHRFVLDVMMLFYLSHPKIAAQGLDREARGLLRANGP